MPEPRLLADEMVGRLARYLRFQGCDVAYVRGLADDAIVARATSEGRVVLTRDRALARRLPGSLLLPNGSLHDQWIAVVRAIPELPRTVAMTRCTLCNGRLLPEPPEGGAAVTRSGSEAVPPPGVPTYRCAACGHRYWDGSHTARVRRQLADWAAELGP